MYFETQGYNTNVELLNMAQFLNEKFTPHNQILLNGQKLFNLYQGDGLRALGKYVQSFVALLSLIPMIEEYTQKVAFLHVLQPWVHKSIVQRRKVPKSC